MVSSGRSYPKGLGPVGTAPLARRCSCHAAVRSDLVAESNSAMTASTWNVARPLAVEVSKLSVTEGELRPVIFEFTNQSAGVLGGCGAARSIFQTTSTSAALLRIRFMARWKPGRRLRLASVSRPTRLDHHVDDGPGCGPVQ